MWPIQSPKILTWMVTTMTFHQHLDICSQCRNNPFSLCPVGHKLLTGQNKNLS